MTSTAYLLYLVFAAGALGVYLMLPKGRPGQARAGAIIGLAGAVGLVAILVSRLMGPDSGAWSFCLFAGLAVVAAVRVITHERPVYSAIYFVLVVVAVAALLLLLEAEFLAIALVIIYAGAILVTYLFVIMLAQQAEPAAHDRRSREPLLAVVAGFVLMGAVAGRAADLPGPAEGAVASVRQAAGRTTGAGVAVRPAAFQQSSAMDGGRESAVSPGNTTLIGSAIMVRYVVALEVAGVLLLVSMIGAIAMARKRVPQEGTVMAPKPIGQIGREVEPF